ncbi:MAG: hypothetical protein RL660_976 [Bacteroidota bacterium]|jgi:hypothetical protein
MQRLQLEANAICKYLVGAHASSDVLQLYTAACTSRNYQAEKKTWFLQSPFLLQSIDAALALLQPKAQLREKILLLTAILETQYPLNSIYTLQQQQLFVYTRLCLITLKSALAFFIGIIIFPFYRFASK